MKATSWQYITDLYDADKNKQCRIAPKLTDANINLNNFQRMKVKYASQVLSNTVSVALNTYEFRYTISQSCIYSRVHTSF